jgi:DNA-binding response OmpR family regulator
VLALAAGADDYLTKPFELSAFGARVREQVRRVGRVPDPVAPASGAVRRPPAAARPAPVQPLEVQLWPRDFDPAEFATPPAAKRTSGQDSETA